MCQNINSNLIHQTFARCSKQSQVKWLIELLGENPGFLQKRFSSEMKKKQAERPNWENKGGFDVYVIVYMYCSKFTHESWYIIFKGIPMERLLPLLLFSTLNSQNNNTTETGNNGHRCFCSNINKYVSFECIIHKYNVYNTDRRCICICVSAFVYFPWIALPLVQWLS